MIRDLPREQIDQILYNAMSAIYQFDQQKVLLFGMTYQDSYLLYFLRERSPVRMSDIARELSVHISTASRAVDRLEKRRFVSRKKDPRDKRNVLVALEPAGRMIMKASDDHSYYTILEGLQAFTDAELMAVIKAAGNLHTILNVPSLLSASAREHEEKSPPGGRR